MNAPYCPDSHDSCDRLHSIAISLQDKISSAGRTQAYATSLSSTVFNWPIGLARNLVRKIDPDDCEFLDTLAKNVENSAVQNCSRRVLRDIGGYLVRYSESSRIIAKLISRVQQIDEIPNNDQDRIVAEELFLPYRAYMQFLNFIGAHPMLLPLIGNDWIWSHNRLLHDKIQLPFSPESLESINPADCPEGVSFTKGSVRIAVSWFGISYLVSPDVLEISLNTLSRFDQIIQPKTTDKPNMADIARNHIVWNLKEHGVIVAKKRTFWGNAPKKDKAEAGSRSLIPWSLIPDGI